jgi:hypothetical protein
LDRSKEDGFAMKQAETNPLRRELARGPQAGPHPDSDMLAAFAEGGLLQRERREMLSHLAWCAECREVLSVAAAADERPVAELKPYLVPRPARPPLREWVPWVSVAAGILMICLTGLLYKQKLDEKQRGRVSVGAAATATATSVEQQPKQMAKDEGVGGRPLKQGKNPSDGGGLRSGSAQTYSGFGGSGRGGSQASPAVVARPHWRIEDGKPERSLSDGEWRAVLPNETAKMRVVSVIDDDVWIGGESSRLYHSTDNGVRWTQVKLPEKNGGEHAIAHVRFQTSRTGTVEAADGTWWTTADGGASWN